MSQADSSKHRILSRPHGSLDGQRNDYLGRKYSVRYEAVNAILLNEFLKQHGAFLEEQRNVQEQQGGNHGLTSIVAKHRKTFWQPLISLRGASTSSQIQKLGEQLKGTRQVPQMVSNNQ